MFQDGHGRSEKWNFLHPCLYKIAVNSHFKQVQCVDSSFILRNMIRCHSSEDQSNCGGGLSDLVQQKAIAILIYLLAAKHM